jgi:hypothetical protein
VSCAFSHDFASLAAELALLDYTRARLMIVGVGFRPARMRMLLGWHETRRAHFPEGLSQNLDRGS